METPTVIEFKLDENQCVKIMANVPEELPELQAYSHSGGVLVAKAEKTFDQSIHVIKSIGNSFSKAVKSMDLTPSEVSVEFGLVLTGKLDAFVTGTSAEANFKVAITWKLDDDKEKEKTQASKTQAQSVSNQQKT